MLWRQVSWADFLRRAHGAILDAWGFGPRECSRRAIASGSYWHLRDYGGAGTTASLLVVAAPIKPPYIWDLDQPVSSIRYCLDHGLRVHLLEWLPASAATAHRAITDCVAAIAECADTVSNTAVGGRPFLIGRSLGGTLGAIAPAKDRH